MAWSSTESVCSSKTVYIQLSVLLLLSTSIYMFLYSRIEVKAFTIEKISDIQKSLYRKEGKVQIGQGIRSHPDTEQGYNRSELLLTLFTSWTTKAEKYICHNNTIRNWLEFKPVIQPILFTNETLLKEEAVEKGWDVLPIRMSGRGVPILKYMYRDVMEKYVSPFYAYSNGDILYSHTLIDTLKAVMNSSYLLNDKPIMIVGRRTNVQNVTSEEAISGKIVNKTANIRGKLFTVWGEDYFITSANYPWMSIPEVIIGRRAYDNWLVLNARKRNHVTIDATITLLGLHQTTKAGNSEGFKADNPGYNHNLLSRMYHRLNYDVGCTSCIEFYTRYHDNLIEILKRNISKSCFPL
ncbi:uncharacterized protein LOC110458058 isoform X2 [Mizuhopecten yessoensis]|uniref:Uncharacterized protein n=2 Tax=Mizuhopecten yessoensis TaxID=6573 RepID=A0A210R3Q0_MIZYE|nr:uncharacterized protein LOC110458058 isoform X2 [Mizuhopecten yessoensis]OWF55609.1 hypothetical protein KP79_PYT11297 [Mizuhopecten yessoensis]